MMDEKLAIGVMPARFAEHSVSTKAWAVIRPFVELLASGSAGEYTAWDVCTQLNDGSANLHMGFLSDNDIAEEASQMYVWDRLVKSDFAKFREFYSSVDKSVLNDEQKAAHIEIVKEILPDFAGFYITKIMPSGYHVWQAYIPKYHRHNTFNKAFKMMEKQAKMLGAPVITFSSNLNSWGQMAEVMGFVPTFTIYRKELGK